MCERSFACGAQSGRVILEACKNRAAQRVSLRTGACAAGATCLSCALRWGTCWAGGMRWEIRNAGALSCTRSQVMFNKHWPSLRPEETPFVLCQTKSLSIGKLLDFSWLLWMFHSAVVLMDRLCSDLEREPCSFTGKLLNGGSQGRCMWPCTHLEYLRVRKPLGRSVRNMLSRAAQTNQSPAECRWGSAGRNTAGQYELFVVP